MAEDTSKGKVHDAEKVDADKPYNTTRNPRSGNTPKENENIANKGTQAEKHPNTETTKRSATTEDTGFFDSKGTAYANLPHSEELVTGGPHDPTVAGPDREGQIPDQPTEGDDFNVKNQKALEKAQAEERKRGEELSKQLDKKDK